MVFWVEELELDLVCLRLSEVEVEAGDLDKNHLDVPRHDIKVIKERLDRKKCTRELREWY